MPLDSTPGQLRQLDKEKVDIPATFAPGNFPVFDPDGQIADTGYGVEALTASIVSQAAAGLTQLGTWNPVNNLTDGGLTLPTVPTGDLGQYYDVTMAGARFGITWAVNDKILIAQKPDGTKLWSKQATTGDLFDGANVYCSGTGTAANAGTMLRPKRQLSDALLVVSQPGTIILAAGSYGASILPIGFGKQNIQIIGRGSNASNQAEIQASIINLNSARIRFRDVNVFSTISWNDATGGHQLQNVGAGTNFVFVGSPNARGFAIISDCDLTSATSSSNIVLQNLTSGSAILYLNRTAAVRMSVGTGWTVVVTDCKDLLITANSGTVIHSDDLPVIAFLDDQVALSAAIANVATAANGMYILGFDGAVGVGGSPAKGDILYRLAPTAMGLHKKYQWAPAAVFGPGGKTWYKSGGYWSEVGSGGSGGTVAFESGVLDTITHGSLTSSASFIDVPGTTFQIPTEGVWEVDYSLSIANSGNHATAVRCVRVSDGAVMPDSMASEGYSPGGTTAFYNVQKSFFVTTVGINNAFKLQWCVSLNTTTSVLYNNYAGGTGFTGSNIPNAGESHIKWQKRAGFLPLTDRISDETTVSTGTCVDVGPLRIQYGTSSGSGVRSVTLPKPFKDANYSVVGIPVAADFATRSFNLDTRTTTVFTGRVTTNGSASGTAFSWTAIGLVP
jgi:hypothetical protein